MALNFESEVLGPRHPLEYRLYNLDIMMKLGKSKSTYAYVAGSCSYCMPRLEVY